MKEDKMFFASPEKFVKQLLTFCTKVTMYEVYLL